MGSYIALVRDKLADNVEPYRFDTLSVTAALQEGYRTLKRIRPSAGYINGRLPREGEDTTFQDNENTEIRSSLDRYGWGIAYFAAGKLLENDNSDTINAQLAASYQQQAIAIFGT